jgi:hypothetical protein
VLTVADLLSRHGPVADDPRTTPVPVSRRPAPRSDGTAVPERGRSPQRAAIAVGVLLAAGSVLGVAVATTTTAPAVGSVPEVRVPDGGALDPAPPGPGIAPAAPRVRVAFPGSAADVPAPDVPAPDDPAPDDRRSGDAGAGAPDDRADARPGSDGPADDDRTDPGAGDDRTGGPDDDSPGSADRDDDRGGADDGPDRNRDEDRPGRGGPRGRGGDGPRGGDDPTDLDDLVSAVVPDLR